MKNRFLFPAAALIAAGGMFLASAGMSRADSSVTSAIAVLTPTSGSHAAGTVRFTAADGGVKVVADVSGLTPGKHGFHIHEFGDISDAAKAMKTGGHYDPAGTHHHELVSDGSGGAAHHAGDMGNLVADDSGNAHLEATLSGVSLTGDQGILGRAVIVHEKADDGGQPTGNAGGRAAQGVIGVAK